MLRIEQHAQTHAEAVNSLRLKIVELQNVGELTHEGAELYQKQMLRLLNEIERYREKCEIQAQQWLEKYHYALGRREAFTMLRSMLESLVNASITRARNAQEIEREISEPREPEVSAPTTVQPVELPPTALRVDLNPPSFACECGREFPSMRSRAAHKRHCEACG